MKSGVVGRGLRSRLMTRLGVPTVAIVLLALHACLLLDGARRNFVTLDEPAHVVAGLSHWQTGDYSMFCVNPPLVRMLAVVPVFHCRPDMSCIRPVRTPGLRVEWQEGEEFVNANSTGFFKLFFWPAWLVFFGL